MNKCDVCRNIVFKNHNEKKQHLISDYHIRRMLEPDLWNKIDELSEKINKTEMVLAETECKNERKKISKDLRLYKKQKRYLLDYEDLTGINTTDEKYTNYIRNLNKMISC
jgi:hypothetical protein